MKKYINSILFLFIVSLLSCGGNDQNEISDSDKNPSSLNYNKKLVETIVNKIVKPEADQFYQSLILLQKATNKFTETQNEESLKILQQQWIQVAKKWARCYAFNIGDLKQKYFNLRFANFPINTEGLEDKIAVNQKISKDYVQKMGSDTKSIYAVEYLIFKHSTDNVVKEFSNTNRKKVLKFIVEELVENASSFRSIWDDYGSVLISKDSKNLSIDNPLNLLFNGLNNVIHYAWETKIGKLAGFEKKSFVILENIEAPYSKKSLEIIKENIKITKHVFFNENEFSIANKIKFVTKDDILNNKIMQQYSKIELIINSIDSPLYDVVQTNRDKIKELYEAIKRLEILFLTDVKSTLSLIITGTDGDGD